MSRALYLAAFAYLGMCLYALGMRPGHAADAQPVHARAGVPGANGADWFGQVRARCNPVEVDVAMRTSPPPPGYEGSAYQAACYALAGKIVAARLVIQALPPQQRDGAVGLFLSIADPVADAGDDDAAGPMMRLVLEFSPDNYIALYHAGISEYRLGERDAAKAHLQRFLVMYRTEDGFRARAKLVLAEMGVREGT